MNYLQDAFAIAALALVAKGMLLLMLGGLAVTLHRRSSAAWRHGVWVLCMVGLLVLPVLQIGGTWWHVPVPAALHPARLASQFESQLAEQTGSEYAQAIASTPSTNGASSPARESNVSDRATVRPNGTWFAWLPSMMLAVWATVSLLILARYFVALCRLWQLQRSASPADTKLRDSVRIEATVIGVRQSVCTYSSEAVSVPMTWGLFRPVLLLPAEYTAWDDDLLRAVLRHELAHVKRHDFLTHGLAHLACALHWVNPLVWYGAHRMRMEREAACDDAVLATGIPATAYAKQLLRVATGLNIKPLSAAVAMAQTTALEGRVRHILSGTAWRATLNGRVFRIGLVTALAVTAALAVGGVKTEGATGAEAIAPSFSNAAEIDGLVRVELLGVGELDGDAMTWWGPDGTPIDGRPTWVEGFSLLPDVFLETAVKARRELAFRFIYSGEERPKVSLRYSDPGTSRFSLNRRADNDPPNVKHLWLVKNFEFGTLDTDVQFNISRGPWQTRSSVADLDHTVTAGDWEVLWTPPRADGQFTVCSNRASEHFEDRIVVKLKNGESQIVLPSGHSIGNDMRVTRFALPDALDVFQYEYQVRPYEKQITFFDVPLNPGPQEKALWTGVRDVSDEGWLEIRPKRQ